MTRMRYSLGILVVLVLSSVISVAHADDRGTRGFLWKQCNEDVIKLHTDPAPYQKLVPADLTVRLFDDRAQVLVIAQDCPFYWLNGEEVGETQEVHMWVAVEGPQDMRPVVGAHMSFPTLTWFKLFKGSNNARGREIWNSTGIHSDPIVNVLLDPPGSMERNGRIVLGADQSLSWRAMPSPPPARLIGVNHDVYTQDRNGRLALSRVQVLLNAFAFDSKGTLQVVGGLGPENCIAPGTYDVEVHSFSPLWIRASLGENPPE